MLHQFIRQLTLNTDKCQLKKAVMFKKTVMIKEKTADKT